RARAITPAPAGTSKTSKTRPVGRITLASGAAVHQRRIVSGSVVASTAQAADTGCSAGAGQPIRSQPQARAPSADGEAPRHTGHPREAYSRAASILLLCFSAARRPCLRRRRLSTSAIVSASPLRVVLRPERGRFAP